MELYFLCYSWKVCLILRTNVLSFRLFIDRYRLGLKLIDNNEIFKKTKNIKKLEI